MGRNIIIIIFIGIVVFAGVLLFQNNTSDIGRTEPTTTPGITPTSAVSPTPISTPEGWEQYESTGHGFSIAHPAGIEIGTTQTDAVEFMHLGDTQVEGTEIYDGFRLTIQTQDWQNDDFRDFVEGQREQMGSQPVNTEITEIENVQIAGRESYQFTVRGLGEIVNIYVRVDDTRYVRITYLVADPEDQGYHSTVTTMIDTLQFE